MKNFITILFLSLAFSTFSISQNMDVGISTPDGVTTLNIDYTANAAYNTPFSIWNNQVITLRWPTSAGAGIIASVDSPTGLQYTTDGAPEDGGDGFYYLKIISSSVNQNIPFAMGETKTMAIINLVDNGDLPAIDIEVLDDANAWSATNAGGPFINNITGNEFNALGETSANVLPIELHSFTVLKGDGKSILDWSTSSEVNGSHFEIERSEDSNSWSQIGTVKAIGESLSEHVYYFVDESLPLNLRSEQPFYYRLKMVDNDGTFEYSEIRRVVFNADGESFIVYPNPSTSEVYVNLSSITTETGAATMHIFNADGQRVKEVALPTSDDVRVDVSSISNGIYHFVVRQGDKTFSQRVVKID